MGITSSFTSLSHASLLRLALNNYSSRPGKSQKVSSSSSLWNWSQNKKVEVEHLPIWAFRASTIGFKIAVQK